MRKTKIICTIGPASDNEETLSKMCEAGMNVARLNFSHGTHEQHQEKIDLIKRVRSKLNLPIAIMLDTKGPEYRIKTFKDHKVVLEDGATFTLTTDDIEGDETRVSVTYKMLPQQLNPGDRVLINNGLVILEVREIKGADVIYHAAGGTGNGVMNACDEEGIWGIGVDKDQAVELGLDCVITSAMKRVDIAAQDVSKAVAEGKFQAGIQMYDLSNGGVDIAPTKTHIPEDVLKLVEAAKADIIAGKKTVPSTAAECAEFILK